MDAVEEHARAAELLKRLAESVRMRDDKTAAIFMRMAESLSHLRSMTLAARDPQRASEAWTEASALAVVQIDALLETEADKSPKSPSPPSSSPAWCP
jgi:hypothetical protein